MLLSAVTEPRYDNEGKCYFDGKLGIWPFVRQVYFYSPMHMFFLFAFDHGSHFNYVVPCFRNQHKEAANIETRVLQSQNQSM